MTTPDHAAAGLIDFPAEADAAREIVALIRRFILIDTRIAALESELDSGKKLKKRLSVEIQEAMVMADMEGPPAVDGMTVYLKPTYYVRRNIDPDTGAAYTAEQVSQALIDAGFASYVKGTHNGSQLRALVREYEEGDQPLPGPLAKVVSLVRDRQVQVTPMSMAKSKAAPRRKPG